MDRLCPLLAWTTTPPADRVGRHGLEIVKAVTQNLDIQREPVTPHVDATVRVLP
ncbi:hypothetical protein [Streptomyces coeruleorubidus]|uniref:hypothetical protein n=1 Tax=Streptomyces coeruleorubidus TaxID=116188 RepID=UPI001E5867C2|nr:hypothetical protein [Streptomyces coeruleorubidus]